jgi:hypothetical protein
MPTYRQKLLLGEVNWETDVIRCLALSGSLLQADIDSNTYTYVSDLTESSIFDVPSDALLSKNASTLGVAESGDIIFDGLTSGAKTVDSFMLYIDTGDTATDLLVAYIDIFYGGSFTAGGGITTLEIPTAEGGFFRV